MPVEAIMQLGLVSHAERDDAKGADYFRIYATLDLRSIVQYGEVYKLMGICNAPIDGKHVYYHDGRSDAVIKADGYNMKLFAVTPEKAFKALRKDYRTTEGRLLRIAKAMLTDFCNEFGGDDEEIAVVFYGY